MEAMLQDLWQTWVKVLTKPSLALFAEEKVRADMGKAVVAMAIAGLIAGIATAIQSLVFMSLFRSLYTDNPLGAMVGLSGGVASIVTQPIGAIVGLFIASGIFYLVAMVLSLRGDFTIQTYLISLVYAPITAIAGIANIVPCLGALVAFAAWIYGLYLLTMALRAVYDTTTGKAIAVWAIPLAVFILLGLCLVVIIGGAILALIGAAGGMR